MPHVELSEFQRNLMNTTTNLQPISMLARPDSVRDSYEHFEIWQRNNVEADALIELGFIEDVSAGHQEAISHLRTVTGRDMRALSVTPIGKAFFDESHPCTSIN